MNSQNTKRMTLTLIVHDLAQMSRCLSGSSRLAANSILLPDSSVSLYV